MNCSNPKRVGWVIDASNRDGHGLMWRVDDPELFAEAFEAACEGLTAREAEEIIQTVALRYKAHEFGYIDKNDEFAIFG